MANQKMKAFRQSDEHDTGNRVSKVPHVNFAFWVIKICATTVGETGGDALSMTLKLGYAVSSLIFLGFFCITLVAQVMSKRYHPFFYWAVVVATTTVGTTMSDYLDRTVGLGYVKSSILLLCGVIVVLFIWSRVTGSIEFENITTKKNEVFYWLTILVSNTLGTALGDFVATTTGLGFEQGALVFTVLLGLVMIAHFFTNIRDNVLFWAAYVLTRPLGATLGDTLTKPHSQGGFELSRITSSLVIMALMVVGIFFTSRTTKQFLNSFKRKRV
ncbi:hypothetical protein G7B40_025500 [Aetokthonos hydrillicola Thurmond2011]|jgi:uncharacterized membrane-anchored protein|uniref:Membrane-anchored protein n=1 Tax=Aetokthonos hydrillicola Thurmond2011 TaxID=2712845 RepID=A0AAP5IAG9_9CYAN|nr:hypothetical protein [Aetokthonos hydrillicola]MBW4586073.1 hypothetical protein [Aetokthonos hydrillicola CCALA 1050]MDR9897893.1 hypothetical protein [Aetokthonos hydrillicola Thurmond2011]